jgi:putative hemolysin
MPEMMLNARDVRAAQPAGAARHLPSARAQRGPTISVTWARNEDDVRAAQRLRYQVFGEEMGAELNGPPGLDADCFDDYCDHLLVRDLDTCEVVGTYRALSPRQAVRLGRLYAQGEFDIARLTQLGPKLVEIGRSCVHRDYRGGPVIMALWAGLADYMAQRGFETMLGCASVPMHDGGHYAANLYCSLRDKASAAAEYRVVPHTPLPVEDLRTGRDVTPPPLVKGYLRLGAKICGAPAWDPHFNTADFLMLLRLSEISPRYARHFFGEAGAPAARLVSNT